MNPERASLGLDGTESQDDLVDLLMDREYVTPGILRYFELFEDPDLTYQLVEAIDRWTKYSFAREVSEPWRVLLVERLASFPREVSERWEYLDSQQPTLKERVEAVRTVVTRGGYQPHEPEFHAQLVDLGVREEIISVLKSSWPKMPSRPSLAHREIFNHL